MVLRQILARFSRPAGPKLMMEDESLGTLTWEDKVGWRGGMTLANGKTATFTLDAAKTDESLPEVIRKAVKFVIANEPRIRARIAVSMSELYNGSWGGGDAITPEELARRITLAEVTVYEEGDGQLFYEAEEDLFTGHVICAYLDADGEIGEPELWG